MDRRKFVHKISLAGMAIPFTINLAGGNQELSQENQIMTVNGPINPDQLGICLPHEHILSRFGVEPEEPATYQEEKVMAEVIPYLKYCRELGIQTIVDCTAAYFGRNAGLLQKLSQESGMQLVTNTGFYGAAKDRYVPEIAYAQPPDQIALNWIREFEKGIYDTGVKPGFVKTAVDDGPLSDIDAKLVRAAAFTHRETGLTMAVHTSGNTEAAKAQLRILKEERVSPQAWIWVHAQNVDRVEDLLFAAEAGAWISLDGLRTNWYDQQKKQGGNTLLKHFQLLQELNTRGFLKQVLLSHDGSAYPPNNNSRRPFDVLHNAFLPMLESHGYSAAEIDQLIRQNPARALAISIKLL
jgi:phosphotriesterase-related protein